MYTFPSSSRPSGYVLKKPPLGVSRVWGDPFTLRRLENMANPRSHLQRTRLGDQPCFFHHIKAFGNTEPYIEGQTYPTSRSLHYIIYIFSLPTETNDILVYGMWVLGLQFSYIYIYIYLFWWHVWIKTTSLWRIISSNYNFIHTYTA